MKLKYKKVKIAMPHCGDCGERLMGNNSMISPYRCSCGEWERDTTKIMFMYKLKSEKEEQ